MSEAAASPGKMSHKNGDKEKKKRGVHCMAPGCTNWYYKCKEKTFHRLPTNESQRKQWLQKLKLASPPSAKSARVCSAHFVDADYKTKDTYDEQGHLVKKKTSFLVKDAVPSVIDFSTYTFGSTDFPSAKSTKTQELPETRSVRRKRRAETVQVGKILLSLQLITYYGIVVFASHIICTCMHNCWCLQNNQYNNNKTCYGINHT